MTDFEIVASPAAPREALDALKTVSADIILLDVEMPGAQRPRGAARNHRARGSGARVLIVSSMAEDGAETTVRALALRRRRYPAQARQRQFRRPLHPRCSPIGCAGSAAPSASADGRAGRRMPADPAARHAGRRRSAASRSAPRPAAFTPLIEFLRALAGADRRADPGHPASAGDLHALFRPPARSRLGPAGAGRRGRRRWSPTTSFTSLRATPISASSGDGSEVRVRLDRKRVASPAACLRPIRCWPRSPTSMATARSA